MTKIEEALILNSAITCMALYQWVIYNIAFSSHDTSFVTDVEDGLGSNKVI